MLFRSKENNIFYPLNCCQLDILLSEAKSILKDALVVLKILVSGFLYILKKILQFSMTVVEDTRPYACD